MSNLDLKFECRDLDDREITFRDYFYQLLSTLWIEKESFNGKRPFGNSGWEYDLYTPLVSHGVVKGVVDEYGDLVSVDQNEADRVIAEMLKELFVE